MQYQWKAYPDIGFPSSIDDTIPEFSLPADEEFHRAKDFNFLMNTFKGLVLNGAIADIAMSFVDGVIQRALGISACTSTSN